LKLRDSVLEKRKKRTSKRKPAVKKILVDLITKSEVESKLGVGKKNQKG